MLTFEQYLQEKNFVSTSTPTKLGVISNENQFITHFYPRRGPYDQVVGVVGEAKTGLDRHIDQYRNLGFKDENIFIFEIALEEYKNLRYHMGIRKLSSGLFYRNIFNPRGQHGRFNPAKVTHGDFDVTTALSPDEFIKEIDLSNRVYPNLASAVYVHSQRNTHVRNPGTVMLFKTMPAFQKLLIVVNSRCAHGQAYYGSRIKEVFDSVYSEQTEKTKFIEYIKTKYSSDGILLQTYTQGKGPMVSFTFCKDIGNGFLISTTQNNFGPKLTQKAFCHYSSSMQTFFRNGIDVNNQILRQKGVAPFTQQEYHYVLSILFDINRKIGLQI